MFPKDAEAEEMWRTKLTMACDLHDGVLFGRMPLALLFYRGMLHGSDGHRLSGDFGPSSRGDEPARKLGVFFEAARFGSA